MEWNEWAEIGLRVLLAIVLGGIVGLEREVTHHAAGFRTHILVCVGSTLVMLTGAFIFVEYEGRTSLDPARLGAQVISGIGFLGAGAILREGVTVRGLTTAASLWIVGCIGLAVGSGFYAGAIIATAATFVALTLLRSFGGRVGSRFIKLRVLLSEEPEALGTLTLLLSEREIVITKIFFEEGTTDLTLLLRLPEEMLPDQLIELIEKAPFIRSVRVHHTKRS